MMRPKIRQITPKTDPDRSVFIFTRPAGDGSAFIAWRWGQATPTGLGPDELSAVQDLGRKEDENRNNHNVNRKAASSSS